MKYIIQLFFIAVLILVTITSVYAVRKEFEFEKVDFKYRVVSGQETTVEGLSKGKLIALGKPQGWGVIEAMFESNPEWADNVELKYYVLLKSKKKKRPVMLAGSVTYVHVEKGSHHVSTMYIPPQAIRRYGEVSRVRVELWYNGVLHNATQWPRTGKKVPWWTRIKPTYGSIWNRFYTPFEHEVQLREEAIKIE